MAFARDSYTATASQTDFTISFSYLQDSHVLVYEDGVLQTEGAGNDYTLPDATTVRFTAGLTGGEVIVIQRATSQSTRLVDYTAGALSEQNLDDDSFQAYYMAQEAIDIANTALGLDTDDLWTAASKRIKNVDTPTAAADAATKAYVDAISAAAGNVPTPDNPGDDGQLLVARTGTFAWQALGDGLADDSTGIEVNPDFFPELFSGFKLTHVDDEGITIGVGFCVDDADTYWLRNTAAAFDKDLTGTFVAGTGNAGLDTGAVAANTLYAVWAIADISESNVVDFLYSTSFTSPTMPTGYDTKRLVGAVLTDATSDIIPFLHGDDHFWFTGEDVLDVNDGTITHFSFEEAIMSVPPNCLGIFGVRMLNTTSTEVTHSVYLRRKGGYESNSDVATAAMKYDAGGITFDDAVARVEVLVDGDSKVEYSCNENNGSATVQIVTMGFRMLTRRMP